MSADPFKKVSQEKVLAAALSMALSPSCDCLSQELWIEDEKDILGQDRLSVE